MEFRLRRVASLTTFDEERRLGRDTFVRNKRAAGRPKDLADLDAITPGED